MDHQMRYIAQVTIAFSANATHQDEFDIWESMVVLDSESPSHALGLALSSVRAVLDIPENWQTLGYSTKPCFYAM
jgi:hypothetical protein